MKRKLVPMLGVFVLALFIAPSLLAFQPCAPQMKPQYFYSGFEYGITQGLIPVPPADWSAVNDSGNWVYQCQNLGCQSWSTSTISTGYAWTDYALQASVQLKQTEACGAAGIVYRFHSPQGQPQTLRWYQFVLRNDGTAALMRFNGATYEVLQTAPFTWQADRWHVLRIEVYGSNHYAYINGSLALTLSDAAYPVGTGGMTAIGCRIWYDNVISLAGFNPNPLAQGPEETGTISGGY